jgi:predicted YcjX-like family ATPase
MIKFTTTNNIAITGIAGGGKTVFLTSLLSHLAEYDMSGDFLGDGVALKSYYELPVVDKLANQFPFERYRRLLAAGSNWPDKTVDHFNFACEFERSDWRFTRQRLNFFDFPGERIADAAVAAFNDYKSWSAHLLNYYLRHPDYEEDISGYFEYLKGDSLSAEGIIERYKLTLAALILGYKTLICPSSFLLDSRGTAASPGTPEQIASQRHCGLREEFQFAPLTEDAINRYPEIAASMAKNYRLYRKEMVLPVFRRLSASDSLVILVDIPSLLAGGVGRYNDNRQMMLDLLDAVRDDSWIGAKLLSVLKFWRPRLRKIAFVASKADMVAYGDVENGRLEALLMQMTTRAARLLPEVETGFFVCSACRSTRKGGRDNTLIGELAHNNPEHKQMEFEVSRLPEYWPAHWDSGDYRFYRVYPQASGNIQIPPQSFGLEGVMSFIL